MSNPRRIDERDDLSQTIDSMPDEFSTADFIRARDGTFLSDLGTPVGSSPNADTGRDISRYRDELGLELVRRDKPTTDDDGHRTRTAVWRKLR